MPKLRKQSFYPLSHTALKLSLLWHIFACYQQQLCLLGKHLSQLWPRIPQISKQYSSIYRLSQFKGWASIIYIPRSQNSLNDTSVDVAQSMQLKAEEPPCTGLAKVTTLLPEQAHATVTNWLTNGNRFGICLVKLASACDTSRLKETTYKRTESVQAGNPLLIRTKLRESRSKVIADKRISLLERIYSETALHQSDSNNFGIRESRLVIRRGSPMRQLSMGFKEVINKDVDLSHLIYNGRQMGRPPSAGLSFATIFYTSSELWRPNFSTPYSILLANSKR